MRQPCRLRRVTTSQQSSLAALIRFHWAAGARVALRANALTLGIVVFAFGWSAPAPQPMRVLRHFVLGVVARANAPDQGPRMTLAGIAVALAFAAVPRVSLGGSGWMRSLPLDRRTSWRAAVVATSIAQIAVAGFALVAAVTTIVVYHAPVSLAKVVTIALVMVAVSAAIVPARNVFGRALAVAACFAAIAGTWPFAGAALVLLGLAEAVAGGVPDTTTQRRFRTLPKLGGNSATAIWVRASWRAMGLRGVIGSALVPVVPTAFAYFITRNNPDLSRETAAEVIRICGGIAVAIFTAGTANALFVARQPWPWARSLPWSSTDRVIVDLFAIGLPLVAVPIALAPLDVRQALIVATVLPVASAFGAASLRGTGKRQTGAAGESLVFTLVVGVGVGMWPALAIVALALTPLVIRWASARDRAWRVTQWTELHHGAAGDPAWLSKS
jgi:hypothetical protein